MLKSQKCRSAPYLHHPIHCMVAGSNDTHEFEELDPSGRYGRYKDVLGKGACKIVYKGFDIVEGIEVAWNQIKVQNVQHNVEDIERFYREVHLLKTLKHKHIIKFYHSWVDTEAMNINFLTEIFTSGTLRQYRKRHKHIDIRALKKWSRQILRGLLYLHSQDPPILHRDLKCDNIFINGNQGEVKIGDLGLATMLNQAHATQSVIGTPEFMAPELFEEKYTELVDIYSFGMCLLEMITGEYPYSECSSAAQIYKKVTSGKRPAALNKIKNHQLRQFLEKCIAHASSRLPARELLMDPFLGDEMCSRVGEICSIQDGSYGVNPFTGSFSDIQSSLMDQSLRSSVSSTSLGSCSSLPDICQEYIDKAGQEMDIQIKGKIRENGIIQLRLRIAQAKDQVRVIHFPFYVGHDTAMSVAKEMIKELDLMDQDVSKLAKVFNDAIKVLVPNWHMGLTTDNVEWHSETPRPDDVVNTKASVSRTEMLLNSSLMDQDQKRLMSWQQKHPGTTSKPAEMEPMKHGRFEEIAYRDHAAVKQLPFLTGDRSGTVTRMSSGESWDAVICPSLGRSRNEGCSFVSSPFHGPAKDTCILGHSTDLERVNENKLFQKEAFNYGLPGKVSLPSIQDDDVARSSGGYDCNSAAWQLKEIALQRQE